jgi:hypothetical protein
MSHLRRSHPLIDLGIHGLTAAAIKYRSFGPCAIRIVAHNEDGNISSRYKGDKR